MTTQQIETIEYIQNTVRLFQDKLNEDNLIRHQKAFSGLEDRLGQTEGRIYVSLVKDIKQLIIRVLELWKVKGDEIYGNMIANLLAFLLNPFELMWAKDKLAWVQALSDALDAVMLVTESDHRLYGTRALNLIIQAGHNSQYVVQGILKSNVLEGTVKLLDLFFEEEKDVDILNEINILLRQFSLFPKVAKEFSSVGFSKLVSVIDHLDPLEEAKKGENFVFMLVEIVWNLLDQGGEISDPKQAIHVLSNLYRNFSQLGFRKKDKEFIDDIQSVLLILSRIDEYKSSFGDSGLLQYLCQSYFSELDVHDKTKGATSIELEKVIFGWDIILSLISDPSNLQLVIEENFLVVLYKILSSPKCPFTRKWNSMQLQELQYQALRILLHISQFTPEHIIESNGLNMLSFILNSNLESGDEQMVQRILHVFVNLSSTSEGARDVASMDLFTTFVDISLSQHYNVHTRKSAIKISTSLCEIPTEGEQLKQVFYQMKGVERVLPFLELNKLVDVGSDEFIYHLVHFIWASVCGLKPSELDFLEEGGICQIIDMIDQGNSMVKYSGLGCLTDLLNNQEAIEQALMWKSSAESKHNLAQLLLNIWKQDVDFDGVDDADLNIKSKVYHLYEQIGDDILQLLEDYGERATFSEIQKYNEILESQAWYGIQTYLNQQNIRPVTPDEDLLKSKLSDAEVLKLTLEAKHKECMEKKKEMDKEIEEMMYEDLMFRAKSEQDELREQTKKLSIFQRKKLLDSLRKPKADKSIIFDETPQSPMSQEVLSI